MICCFGYRSLKHSSRKSWIMALKCWRIGVQHFPSTAPLRSVTPKCLSGPSPHAINAMKLMKTDWLCLQSLECSGAPKARMLSADLRLTFDPCMHYTALQFQSVGWRLNYQAGLDLLRFSHSHISGQQDRRGLSPTLTNSHRSESTPKTHGDMYPAAADQLRHIGVSGHGSPCQVEQREVS